MTVEIEYYKGDTLLQGEKISFDEFKKQINTIEKCVITKTKIIF